MPTVAPLDQQSSPKVFAIPKESTPKNKGRVN